jgi:hypothetical protein
MRFETWIPEPGFLIGLAAALSPCRQVAPVAEQQTVTTQHHQMMVIK